MEDRGSDEGEAPPIPVPHRELSEDALRGVVEAFVLREGTDYGDREYSLEQKVAQVLRQLDRGEARIVFHPGTRSTAVVTGAEADVLEPPTEGAQDDGPG